MEVGYPDPAHHSDWTTSRPNCPGSCDASSRYRHPASRSHGHPESPVAPEAGTETAYSSLHLAHPASQSLDLSGPSHDPGHDDNTSHLGSHGRDPGPDPDLDPGLCPSPCHGSRRAVGSPVRGHQRAGPWKRSRPRPWAHEAARGLKECNSGHHFAAQAAAVGVGRQNDGENDPRGTRTQKRKRSAPTFPTHARSLVARGVQTRRIDREMWKCPNELQCEKERRGKGGLKQESFQTSAGQGFSRRLLECHVTDRGTGKAFQMGGPDERGLAQPLESRWICREFRDNDLFKGQRRDKRLGNNSLLTNVACCR